MIFQISGQSAAHKHFIEHLSLSLSLSHAKKKKKIYKLQELSYKTWAKNKSRAQKLVLEKINVFR